METYRCAYRDPHSPLTPLAPACHNSLRQTLRDHSPSLMPTNKIVLDKCPSQKRKRTPIQTKNGKSTVEIVVSTVKTPTQETFDPKSSYLQNLRRILTPTSRHTPKSRDLEPAHNKRPRFTCFQCSPRSSPLPMSPRLVRVLQDIGQEKYADVFRREEIDLEVFKILTKSDLTKLGIEDEADVPVILKAIHLVKNW